MKECAEHTIKVGFRKSPKKIFDKIESISAEMSRKGWRMYDVCFEDGLGYAHLFFEREIEIDEEQP